MLKFSAEESSQEYDQWTKHAFDLNRYMFRPIELWPVWDPSTNPLFGDLLESLKYPNPISHIRINTLSNCVLCTWRGAVLTLDHHMRTIHESKIQKYKTDAFNGFFTLGLLMKEKKWNSILVQTGDSGKLFMLSAMYLKPDILIFSLTTTYTDKKVFGSITIHNRFTGEPFTWEGEVKPLTTITNGLKVKLNQLNLLVATGSGIELKLVGGRLITKLPGKLVSQQKVLANFPITILCKVFK